MMQIGFQPAHEDLLFGSSYSDPNNISAIGFNYPGNSRIIEFLYLAERQFDELHLYDIGIFFLQVGFQTIQDGL